MHPVQRDAKRDVSYGAYHFIVPSSEKMIAQILVLVQLDRFLGAHPHSAHKIHLRYVNVTPATHTAGGALRICHTRHSHGRRCVTYMSHPSLTRQAVRYVYVTIRHQVELARDPELTELGDKLCDKLGDYFQGR